MENISIYLEKFKSLGFKERELKDVVIKVFKDKINVDLKRENIDLNNELMRINISGVEKSEFFIYKDLIQKEIIKRVGDNRDFKDII